MQGHGIAGTAAILLLTVAVNSVSGETGPESVFPSDARHLELVGKANRSVEEARPLAESDPLRPIYHLTTAANWINDPNGPVYFKGEYHIFFQHNPYGDRWGNMSWGHAVSKDLVRWKRLSIALVPGPDTYDEDGVFSGCCVIDNDVPTIIYTGTMPEVQCIARSYDNLRTWSKFEGNPVIAQRPMNDLEGFRNPFAWREEDGWYMVIGSGIKGKGGVALLYHSDDLEIWDFLHPLCTGFGRNWECPNFFPLGGKYVLVVSPEDDVRYSVGDYTDHRFTPGEWRLLDLGGREVFYAPNSLKDKNGRRVLWGWIPGGGTEGYPWNGVLTLPRVISLRGDGALGIKPLSELARLRGAHYTSDVKVLRQDETIILDGVRGNTIEILAEFEPGNAASFGLELLRSPDGKEKTTVMYDASNILLSAGDLSGEFQLFPGETTLTLHVFLDRSVIEVYANGRASLTARAFPKNAESLGLALFSRGDSVKIHSLDIWDMQSIW